MKRQMIVQTLISLLLLSGFLMLPVTSTPGINNPYELIITTVSEPDTVDPAWAYDAASMELISNVYDTLIRFEGESVDEFEPCLATAWSYDEVTYTYTFEIRQDVPWHDWAYGTLTPEDVEYSFERWMVQDRLGGPAWMIYELLLGMYHADMDDPEMINKIDAAVESDATHVYFHLIGPFSPLIFYQVIAQSFASIIDRDWAIEQGCWDGIYTMESLETYHDPAVSPLDDPEPVMMGTGPYEFDYWEPGIEWSIYKNDDYWRGWPAQHPIIGSCRGYVTRVTEKYISEWATRKLMFLAGDVDIAYVPRQYIHEVFCQTGIRCVYPLPTLTVTAMFFNFYISTTSPYLGPGFDPADPYMIAEDRIPIDFFSDVDVRKGFAYSFDYLTYIGEAFSGEATQPATCVIDGILYKNLDQEKYYYDLTQAQEHFMMAWGGTIWEDGFTMTLVYNTGSEPRMLACEMLESAIESLNPKFHIDLVSIDWLYYIYAMVDFELPIFIIGWLADYPDPHNFVYPFMHSQGAYTYYQSYSNSYVDSLIDAGIESADPTERESIYYELQAIYHNECISVPLYQPCGRHWERDWVQGWYYNLIYPGVYAYHLWKEELPPEDINMDGSVNILDTNLVALAYGTSYEPGYIHPRWNSRADINCDQKVDDYDAELVANMFGWQAPPWTPPDVPTPPDTPDEVVIEVVIVPEELTTDVVTFKWPEPLQEGDVVTPSVSELGNEYRVSDTTWFYWINDYPYAMFAHDTRYVFVDAETLEYEVMVEKFPPALNGEEFWKVPEEFWNTENWVYTTGEDGSNGAYQSSMSQGISSLASLAQSWTASDQTLESQWTKRALIIEGHDPTGSGKNASELWYNSMVEFGYSDQDIVYLTPVNRDKTDAICTEQNVLGTIQNLANSLTPGDELNIFIFAHGYIEDDHHTGGIFLDSWRAHLYDWELERELSQIQTGVNITVVIESCYSGSFMDNLWILDNVNVIITSTDWKSVSYTASKGIDPPRVYKNIEDLRDDPNPEDEGGEFSSGLIQGLDELRQQYLGGTITFGELYVKAFLEAEELDAGYINGEKLAEKANDLTKKPDPLMNTVFFEGDIDHDGRVGVRDLYKVSKAFQSYPGHQKWDPEADIDKSGDIRVRDLHKISKKFDIVYFTGDS